MDKHLKTATILAKLLDTQFGVGKLRFGIDPILGVIPGLGDILSLLFSLYLIWIAIRSEVPEEQITKMLRNILADLIIGAVPVIGDIGDAIYKANSKNLEIIKKYSGKVVEGEIVG